MSERSQAELWMARIFVMQDQGLLSIAMAVNALEQVSKKFNLTWSQVSDLSQKINKDIDVEASSASVNIVWK
jgi:hypothetical protein